MPKRLLTQQNRITARFAAWWRRRRLAARIAMIAGLSVLALGLTLMLTLWMWIRPPAYVPIEPPPIVPNLNLPPGVSPPVHGGPGEEERVTPRGGIYTFLLAGIHEGSTDTLMVATLDTERGTCHVLSVPRDTLIARAPRTVKKINSAYSQRQNTWDNEPGIKQLKKEIATLIGFQPQYTAVVDYNAFRRLVTAIDGVEFNVPMRMYVPAEGIDLYPGWQHLNADQALQLVRFRYNPGSGTGYDDYGRMRMQQQFLATAAKKAFANWTKYIEYVRIAQDHVVSDMDWGNLGWFADQIQKIGMDNVVFATLPTTAVRRPAEIAGEYYEAVNATEALKLINETINPLTTPIGEELVEYIVLTER
jgi:LCP family protein required for cell wall assembly